MPQLKDIAGVVASIEAAVPAAATAATARTVVGRAPFKSKVVGAYWVPTSGMTGAASANRYLEVVNAGSAGTGTAVAASKTYTASADAVAYASNTVTAVTTTAANLAEGDVIVVDALVNSTGLPLPAGRIVVTLQGR